jgi:hypothetical protein
MDWTNVLSVINVICLAWAIAATECTLAWNQISGINSISSTGQLIPFIIGVVSLAQIIYTIVVYNTQVILSDMLLVSIFCNS